MVYVQYASFWHCRAFAAISCADGVREEPDSSASNTQDTLNHTETRDTESTNSPIPHWLCMQLLFVHGSAEEVCSFLKNVGTDAAEGFPQCSLSSSHLLLTFFRIYITVSGPACTLLCTSGEVYKKCVEKLIPSGQAKLEIKRYCSFSLGWHSSKGGEMDYKYRYRSWHFYSIP